MQGRKLKNEKQNQEPDKKIQNYSKDKDFVLTNLLRKISSRAAVPLHMQRRSVTKNTIHGKMHPAANHGKTEVSQGPEMPLMLWNWSEHRSASQEKVGQAQ